MNVNLRFLACGWHRRSLRRRGMERLTAGWEPGLERHLAACPACRAYARQLDAVLVAGRTLAGTLPIVEPPATLTRRWEREIGNSQPSQPRVPAVSERRAESRGALAWGGLAAAWLVIALLRWSAPSFGTADGLVAPISWRELRMVLGQDGKPGDRAEGSGRLEVVPAPDVPAPRPRGDRGEIPGPAETRYA